MRRWQSWALLFAALLVCLAPSAIASTADDTHEARIAALEALHGITQQASIVAIGDSEAYCYGLPRGEDWPTLLDAENAGVNGDTTRGMLARFDADTAGAETVIILGGENDIYYGYDPSTNDDTYKLPAIKSNVEAMVAKAEAASQRVIVCTILPHGTIETVPARAQAMQEYRTWLLAQPFEVVDLYAVVVDPAHDGYPNAYPNGQPNSLDNIHPSATGAQLIADALTSALGGQAMASPLTVYAGVADAAMKAQRNTTYADLRNDTSGYETNTGESPSTVGEWNVGIWENIFRIWLPFDTSGVPDDATVTNVTLNLHLTKGATGQGVYVVPTDLTATTGVTDYNETHFDTSSPTSAGSVAVGSINNGAYNAITIDTGVIAINKTGSTYMGLRADTDFNQSGSGQDTSSYTNLVMADNGSNHPYLVITYTEAGTPYYYRNFVTGGG